MKIEPLKLIHGSGNVFRDFGFPDAGIRQLKACLAAQIIKTLDRKKMTVRQAQAQTGIAAADFSRIGNADLSRFTVDRLMTIINKLGMRIDIAMKFKPIPAPKPVKVKARVAAKPKAKSSSKKTTK